MNWWRGETSAAFPHRRKLYVNVDKRPGPIYYKSFSFYFCVLTLAVFVNTYICAFVLCQVKSMAIDLLQFGCIRENGIQITLHQAVV